MTFGLTPFGFVAKRLADLKQDLENAFIAEFGDVNIEPQSVFGQEIGVMAKQFADIWENLEDVYFSQYPNSAEGVALDNVVQLNGLTRLPAQRTAVTAVCAGNESTLIPSGSLARIANTNNVFFNPADGVITSTSAYQVTVSVVALAAQVYTVIINSQAFIYSLPIITFTGSFIAGNIAVVTLNGVQLAPVPFNTDSDTTLDDIATEIALNAAVASAVATAPDTIEIVPNLGFSVTINSIQNTGSGAFPTSAITFDVPASVDDVSEYLAAVIEAGAQPVSGDDLTGSFTITADDADVPFSASVQPNLSITGRSSPIPFLCQDFGPIPCPANSLTEILSPIGGWDSVNNPKAGVTGRFIETDAELRLRRLNSIRLLGNATVEAIRARVLQNVPGVITALVFENQTMVQEEIDIVFSAPLVAGNDITITLNSTVLPTITFATSSVATMGQLALLLAAQPEVSTCTVGGASNNILEINMNVFQSVIINDVSITGGASQADTVVKGGRPPKSFEVIIEGGSDADIAEEIWLSKPAGIQTFGNTNFTIVDSQGDNQVIFFSRPTPIYIWVQVTLTLYAEETFPINGLQLVQEAILAYGDSLGIGVDVLLQRVNCAIFAVPGVASGVMQLAATNGPDDAPSFGSADITIEENEVSVWDLTRIAVTV
jgi:uncharacterized phage protein gp47/JayE